MTASTDIPPSTPTAEISASADYARAAFVAERRQPTFTPEALLRAVALRLEQARAELLEAAGVETSLSRPRLEGELTRTTRQLEAFAQLTQTGLETDAIIDLADPEAQPPRPDQRRLAVPLGPVAVFAASNFPFAFSVAGGDTAAAWAAGCPVLLKAHPAHPRTSVLTAAAISAALGDAGAPPAWFTIVHGAAPETGQALVAAEAVEAVAFTGSLAAGTAIARTAAARPRPIPAYCEMGSTNPVVVTPAAARERSAEIADGLAASIAGSLGQLCTKPGLVLMVADEAGERLATALGARLSETDPAVMLYPGIRANFADGIRLAAGDQRVDVRAGHPPQATPEAVTPVLFEIAAARLAEGDTLLEEIFGPASVIIWADDEDELVRTAEMLPGSLTATLHAEPGDPVAQHLLERLGAVAGRIVYNGYPTGVTVGHATVHGGPFPATTASAHTSVGMTAVRRFQRPLGYQDVPDELLPAALQDANPLGIPRRLNGVITAAAVTRH